jgi:amidase
MTLDELWYLDLVEVGRRIQARQLSSLDVTQAILDRIAQLDPRFKSYAKLTPDLALAQARQADSEIARGVLIVGPLFYQGYRDGRRHAHPQGLSTRS